MKLERKLAIFFGALSAAAGVFTLLGISRCVQHVRYGVWADATSPIVDLVAAPRGVWEHRWGETASHDHVRSVEVRAPDGTYPTWPSTLRFDLRFTPPHAVEPTSAARADGEGWIACAPANGAFLGFRFDPSLVERIEWRADESSTPSANSTPPFVMHVSGLADSEFPHDWINDVFFAAAGALAALVFGFAARRNFAARRKV
jgi:hypothetical protein